MHQLSDACTADQIFMSANDMHIMGGKQSTRRSKTDMHTPATYPSSCAVSHDKIAVNICENPTTTHGISKQRIQIQIIIQQQNFQHGFTQKLDKVNL